MHYWLGRVTLEDLPGYHEANICTGAKGMASTIAHGFASSQQPSFGIGSALCESPLSMTALVSVVRFVVLVVPAYILE
jgi:hypothetical protein